MAHVRHGALVATLLLAACRGDDGATEAVAPFPVRIQVTNVLVAPVTIAIDGIPSLILGTGRGSALTVSSAARSLTWTSAKPTDAAGVQIPDDIGEVTMPLASIGPALEISNVIGGQTHITARIVNRTAARVSIGVANDGVVSCAAVLPATVEGVTGFVLTGYYRLRHATELRAYRDATRCAGAYVAWPADQLTKFTAKTGQLVLTLDAAP